MGDTAVARFPLGKVIVGEGASHALDASGQSADELIGRHARGDWGDVSEETRTKNEDAIASGRRIESIYHTHRGEKLLVVTEADRSLTMVLLPEEF